VQGKLAQAAVHWERAAEVNPDDYQSVVMLRGVYTALGLEGAAERAGHRGIERAEKAAAKNPANPRPAYLLAITLAAMGAAELAREWAVRALGIDPEDVLTRYNLACYHTQLGEYDQAFDLLEALLPRANHDMKAWVLHDSDFDSLHEYPRWQRVLALAR
jgi:adenylate cyclase